MRKNALPQKKVLVTGASGYIGSVLTPLLLKKGFYVRCLDIAPFASFIPKQYAKSFEYKNTDIRRIKQEDIKDIFAVIHLAAFSDEASANKNLKETKRVNINATISLAKKAKKQGVKRFIFASSSSIYDRGIDNDKGAQEESASVFPDGIYSISKLEAEKELLALADKNFSVIILRKATVCGYSPNMRFDLVVNAMVKSVLIKGHIKVFCRGKQWRPLISINDVAKAYYTTLTAPDKKINGEIFNIGLNNFKVSDIALLVQKTFQNSFSINPAIIFEEDNRKDRSYQIATGKAKAVFGFESKVTIEQTIVDLVRKLKQKGVNL